jgi:hypothetical protein
MKVIIDRFEGEYAVCEKDDITFINIQSRLVPNEAKEGDVLVIEGESISIDLDETNKIKKDIEKLVENLWE